MMSERFRSQVLQTCDLNDIMGPVKMMLKYKPRLPREVADHKITE